MAATGHPHARGKDFDRDSASDSKAAWLNVAYGLIAIGLALLLPTARRLDAQQPAEPVLKFEVASVKPNTSGAQTSRSQFQPGGRYVVSNGTIERLFRNAYTVQPFQILGAPGWFTTERFDIDAKADGNITLPQLQAMLKTLLRERCQLAFHKEMRDLPIYTLVLARADGRRGPSLKSSAFDCSAMANGPPPATAAPTAANGLSPCGSRIGSGNIISNGTSMVYFAGSLSNLIGRTVVDGTGLTGDFDLTLTYAPETAGTAVRHAITLHCRAGAARLEARVRPRAGRGLRYRSGGTAGGTVSRHTSEGRTRRNLE